MAYSKTTWNDNDVITKEKMNNLESGDVVGDKVEIIAITVLLEWPPLQKQVR